MNIAVIGAGSSGLITLKYVTDSFPNATVTCFEKGDSVRGCWGNQRDDFISTSTKYTTQFSCFRKYQLPDATEQNFDEFYRGKEFGDYLEDFAEHFELGKYIQFGVALEEIIPIGEAWQLKLSKNGQVQTQYFDAVFICTGLVNQKLPIESQHVPVAENFEAVRDSKVVVVGGGESATDIANHLAKPEFNNEVYLSLRSGVRVSPRYHPIRGVPSDFLRNRLLLSFNKTLRNKLGEGFVSFRIRFEEFLAKVFPHRANYQDGKAGEQRLRKMWDMKLKARAKGALFNVFHNKSDAFLDAVAENRLSIIGPAKDTTWTKFYNFDQDETLNIMPDVLVPSTGYRSRLADLSKGTLQLKDFYHGCVYISNNNLFLIGFARPIIGNIPSISEMQARYAVGMLSGKHKLPEDVREQQHIAWKELSEEYSSIDVDNVYPVEQFPYCDVLAKEMGMMPTLKNTDFRTWVKLNLVPASTLHYINNDIDDYFDKQALSKERIYTPPVLIFILLIIRIAEMCWQAFKNLKISPNRKSKKPLTSS